METPGLVINEGVPTLDAAIVAAMNAGAFDLFANNVNPVPSSKLGDFVTSSFPGYAQVAPPVFSAIQFDAEGRPYTISETIQFLATTPTPAFETAYGILLEDDPTATVVLAAVRFDPPVLVALPGQAINVTIRIYLDTMEIIADVV